MPASFDNIQIGSEYTRPEIAELWEYVGYEAISRGAATPRETPFSYMWSGVMNRDKDKTC
jgi:hypothetical protein